MLRISGTGATHVGLVRENNEDAGFIGPFCMLIADGVGGGAAGEVASATTAYVVSASAMTHQGEPPAGVLTDAVRQAQGQLALGVEQDPDRGGMATTLTALLTDGKTFALAHIGDSRGYVFRDDQLTRITTDHTYVQGLVDEGRLEENAMATHPWRNMVMRSVNGRPDEKADVTPLSLAVGDRVLLATDGLTDMISEEWITEILRRHDDDAAIEALIAAALGCGGRDNVTCVLATIIDGPRVSADGILIGSVRDVHNIVDAAAVHRAKSA
ncbi:MAG: protein phosphatase domain protein [Marmoricola sp.]|nr:protein phosphatase domain protein [Marmoricola sp.]